MVQCELCGSETSSPRSIKVEGAELDVCDSCASLGSEVSQSTGESTTTKYSTDSSGSPSSSSTTTPSPTRQSSGGSDRSEDMYESLGTLAQDYDDRIRQAREQRGLSQSELADELNEKRSLISKLERGETLPNDSVQKKLERFLDIDLEEGSLDADEWQAEDDGQEFTLGEMAERKD